MMTSTNGKSPASSETVLKPKRRRLSVAEKIRILKAVDAAAPGKQDAVFAVKRSIRRKFQHGGADWSAAILIARSCISASGLRTNRRQPIAESPIWNAKFAACGDASSVRSRSGRFKKKRRGSWGWTPRAARPTTTTNRGSSRLVHGISDSTGVYRARRISRNALTPAKGRR